MARGKGGHKPNNAAKRKRAIYKAENRLVKNKDRKAGKEAKKREKKAAKLEARRVVSFAA